MQVRVPKGNPLLLVVHLEALTVMVGGQTPLSAVLALEVMAVQVQMAAFLAMTGKLHFLLQMAATGLNLLVLKRWATSEAAVRATAMNVLTLHTLALEEATAVAAVVAEILLVTTVETVMAVQEEAEVSYHLHLLTVPRQMVLFLELGQSQTQLTLAAFLT
jgi:hypothetical protein